jgi:predicted nucleic acid-binding protein
MKAVLDTNVVLDVLLKRRPFDIQSLPLLVLAEQGAFSACLVTTTVTTAFYVLSHAQGTRIAHGHLAALLDVFEIARVDRPILRAAVQKQWRDYEDAVLHEAALAIGAEAIITRNVSDFKKAKIAVYTPNQFIELLRSREDQNE